MLDRNGVNELRYTNCPDHRDENERRSHDSKLRIRITHAGRTDPYGSVWLHGKVRVAH